VAEVLALCGGLASCDFNVTAAALNVTDPCAATAAKWLIVAAACDNSWRTQDYVMAPKAGPARHCSPRRMVSFNSINEDLKCVG